jgi:VWFA-related protein
MPLSAATPSGKRDRRRFARSPARAKTVLVLVLAATAASGQDAARNSRQGPEPEKPLVRVNVDLVQMDVVVTDAKGNHITDLKPQEFEILENGKPQRITNFSFIPGARIVPTTKTSTNTMPADGAGKGAPPMAPAPTAAGGATRTIVVIVDDLGIGEQSFAAVHAALEKFVDQQVGPADLVAIITTSGRLGSLQCLTSDTRLLRAAVAKFRSIPNHRTVVGDDDFTCAYYKAMNAGRRNPGAPLDEDGYLGWVASFGGKQALDAQEELQSDQRSLYYGLLSLSVFRRVVDGLRELPGRRSILLFSEGLPLVRAQGAGETNSQITDGYEAFINHANRSGISVDTIDPRGLIATFETADGAGCRDAKMSELTLTQQQLADLARRTGGIAIFNDNDIAGAMGRVMDDQAGYYLIAYKPPPVANGGHSDPGFRKITIHVTRPALKLRYHNSLYEQEPDQALRESASKGGEDPLVAAVASPFAMRAVRVRLASRYWDGGPGVGSVLDNFLQIDARDLTFLPDGDGRRKANFDILALISGSATKPLDTVEKNYTISLTEAAWQRALREGLVQKLQMRLKQPGAYQLRSAVRDRYSGRLGSASDFIEVPDLTRGRLALSGIALSGKPGKTGQNTEPTAAESFDRLRFRAGETVLYACQILNAYPAPDGSTNVEVRATLYYDGKALGTSAPIKIDPRGQADVKRLVFKNDFRPGKQLTPGDYTLQLTVVDKNAPNKRATATQSTDFEIVE